MLTDKPRCAWVTDHPLYIQYHDEEWGQPVYDDRLLFEFLILEGAQAGLNWLTVLKKRDKQKKILSLLDNAGIIRNQLKINAAITNAQAFLQVQEEYGNFSDYLWHFVDGKPIINHWKNHSDVPATSPISDKLAKDLKKRGFKFVGSTICYAFMQAVGMVNDHTTHCFRHQ